MGDLRIDHLSYAYPGATQPVLRDIHLHIPRGEFVLVAGPSGCGKSTLALALAGLIPARIAGPMRGNVYLDDRCITRMNIHDTSQHVGMVFQNPDNQLIHLDVEAEVAFGPENLGLSRADINSRVEQSLRFTGMATERKSTIYGLSGGQKQRVAISATLAMRPEVLVLDEPTSDLDPAGTQEVLSVLRHLNREWNMTIVLIEHKIDEVIPWVDRVLLMDEGRIVKDDVPSRVFADEESWDALGVSVPELVRLSHRLPDVFDGQTALRVEEAVDALAGTPYQRMLRSVTTHMPLHMRATQRHNHSPHRADSLLEWRSAGLSFGNHSVLRDVNLQVGRGEWVALAGPNGSGKTSLASMAMGFLQPSAGQIVCDGQVVRVGKTSALASRLGYLFQAADNMLFGATVRKELTFGRRHRRNGVGGEDIAVSEITRLIDLVDSLDQNPFHLSHGQRKRLALGALLAANPQMLILDEPTTGQDEGHAKAFLDFLQELRRVSNMTYLMITHDMRAAAHFASRLVVLRQGEILLDGAPRHVFSQSEALSEASIVAPPIARLHAIVTEHRATEVALDLDDLLHLLRAQEVPM